MTVASEDRLNWPFLYKLHHMHIQPFGIMRMLAFQGAFVNARTVLLWNLDYNNDLRIWDPQLVSGPSLIAPWFVDNCSGVELVSLGFRNVRSPMSPQHCFPVALAMANNDSYELLKAIDNEAQLSSMQAWLRRHRIAIGGQELPINCPLCCDWKALVAATNLAKGAASVVPDARICCCCAFTAADKCSKWKLDLLQVWHRDSSWDHERFLGLEPWEAVWEGLHLMTRTMSNILDG